MRTIKLIFLFLLMSLFSMAQSIDLKNGLVGYYPFNGNANDESGNRNNGSVIGASLTSDRNGNPNSAYFFNGRSDYISISRFSCQR